MISAELKPCPFCGDVLVHIWSPAHGGYSVICGNACGAEGPVMENEERAAEAWNRRVKHCIDCSTRRHEETLRIQYFNELEAARSRIAELERDASRYRFIRDVPEPLVREIANTMIWASGEGFDRAIDAAILRRLGGQS